MKNLLDGIVSENQSAFIPGRLISDNIMVSYEVMHCLKRKRRGNEGYMAMKIDMSKAYDRIEWRNLQAILLKMGFHMRWVERIIANEEEARSFISILENYELASRQQVNKSKSSVFFSSNIGEERRHYICQVLQMTEAGEDCIYLGLPNMMGRSKSATLGFLKGKVKKQIDIWDGRHISQGGREIPVMGVAQTLPTYAMSVFML
ncbi:uncharacterized protein LOC141660030 [Apium graveolens]|uniref:uncharacterized protein LOC141660030 n=1 Tax=Apium graveolens TaxID=4045 RepID=UPI003D7BCD6E